jgi:two-component system response regulator DegU
MAGLSIAGDGWLTFNHIVYEAKREEGRLSVPTLVASDATAASLPVGAFIRVLVADDHTLFRDGIARLLAKEVDIAVVGQARNGNEAIDLSRQLNPHVILMDISMPGINGIEATRVIHAQAPGIRIIGLSMYEDEERAEVMRQAGAVGYKSKTCPVSELVAAVRDAVRASG